MAMLKRVILKGFKSIREVDLELRPLNVMIGANGAGKSNLVSFFKMIGELAGGRLQNYVAAAGRAHSLLFYGPRVTPQIWAQLDFETPPDLAWYSFVLSHAAGDALYFADEQARDTTSLSGGTPREISFGSGHPETRLQRDGMYWTFWSVTQLLDGCRVYHFHDTSPTARIRQYGYVDDNRSLASDGANLAAFLYRLQNQQPGISYDRIVRTVRLIAPFFHDFNLVPSGRDGTRDIILNWRDKESDLIFGPHQLSDGTLRAMCLVALLLQPEAELPEAHRRR